MGGPVLLVGATMVSVGSYKRQEAEKKLASSQQQTDVELTTTSTKPAIVTVTPSTNDDAAGHEGTHLSVMPL